MFRSRCAIARRSSPDYWFPQFGGPIKITCFVEDQAGVRKLGVAAARKVVQRIFRTRPATGNHGFRLVGILTLRIVVIDRRCDVVIGLPRLDRAVGIAGVWIQA